MVIVHPLSVRYNLDAPVTAVIALKIVDKEKICIEFRFDL